MGLFGNRQPRKPIKLTADNSNVILNIRKDWLIDMSKTDEAAAGLLRILDGRNDGDWGGADYPEISIRLDHAAQILKVLETAALLCSPAG